MKYLLTISGLLGVLTLFSGCATLCRSDADQETIAKLKAEIIPVTEFRQANISDIVDFYNMAHLDDDEPVDPATEVLLVLPQPVIEKVPRVTFKATKLSMYNSLVAVSKMTGLTFKVENGRPWLIYEE